MRHFSTLSEEEMGRMAAAAEEAVVRYAKYHDLSGLSEGHGETRTHDVYVAIQEAIRGEWERSKRVTARRNAE